MKRLLSLLLTLTLVLSLAGCGQKAPTWQEQYDLGIRYLSEGNYKEAVIAFTAAIEIDPRRPEAYIGLADVYTAQGDLDKAAEILEQALEAIGENDALRTALDALALRGDPKAAWWHQILQELPVPPITLNAVATSSESPRNDGGTNEYDAAGDIVRSTSYYDSGDRPAKQVDEYYRNPSGDLAYRTRTQYIDDQCSFYALETYDDTGRLVEERDYNGPTAYGAGSIEIRSCTYSGSTAELSLTIIYHDGQEIHWSHSYSMADPRNEAVISGFMVNLMQDASGNLSEASWNTVSITEHDYQSKGAIVTTKFDVIGAVLETKQYR